MPASAPTPADAPAAGPDGAGAAARWLADFYGLHGRTILVTGASSGIGRACALRAARLGARLVLLGTDAARLEAVHGACGGGGHAAVPFDLRQVDAIPGLLQDLARRVGPLDCVVHCAGVQALLPVNAFSAKRFAGLFDVNVAAALALAKGFRLRAVRGADPRLVLLSSAVARRGAAARSAYAASKGAVEAAVRSLAVELAPEGIKVNCVAPGVVRTPMLDAMREAMGPEAFAAMAAAHPLGLGGAEDVAGAVAFLLSPSAAWITGATLAVDGGFSIN